MKSMGLKKLQAQLTNIKSGVGSTSSLLKEGSSLLKEGSSEGGPVGRQQRRSLDGLGSLTHFPMVNDVFKTKGSDGVSTPVVSERRSMVTLPSLSPKPRNVAQSEKSFRSIKGSVTPPIGKIYHAHSTRSPPPPYGIN